MITLQKTGFIPVCLALAFHSCRPISVYQSAAHVVNSNNTVYTVSKPSVYLNDIPIRAIRGLLKRYPAANEIKWQKSTETGWIASFKMGAVETLMDFDPDGTWSHIYNVYTETPADIQSMLSKSFSDYRINSVRGIIFPADDCNILFSVVISKEDNCKVLKLYKGNLTVFSDVSISATALK